MELCLISRSYVEDIFLTKSKSEKQWKNLSEKGKIVVKALVTGGSASGGPPIGPAVGPTGINGNYFDFRCKY